MSVTSKFHFLYRIHFSVIDVIERHGGIVLYVGGCVRDILLGRKTKDFDMEVYLINADTIFNILSEHFCVIKVGVSFGVIKIVDYNIDLSIPRIDIKHGIGHKGFVINFSPYSNFYKSSSRRDFTINAIGYDYKIDRLIDVYGGLQDILSKNINSISYDSFNDDPLRILRGVRFASQLGFSIGYIIHSFSLRELSCLSKERISSEIIKILKAKYTSIGIIYIIKHNIKLNIFVLYKLLGLDTIFINHVDIYGHFFSKLLYLFMLSKCDIHMILSDLKFLGISYYKNTILWCYKIFNMFNNYQYTKLYRIRYITYIYKYKINHIYKLSCFDWIVDVINYNPNDIYINIDKFICGLFWKDLGIQNKYISYAINLFLEFYFYNGTVNDTNINQIINYIGLKLSGKEDLNL